MGLANRVKSLLRLKEVENLIPAHQEPHVGSTNLKWSDAQNYEFSAACEFMKSQHFIEVLEVLNNTKNRLSLGHIDKLMLKEFFSNDLNLFQEFVKYISGKNVLEIGPCVATALSTWDVASNRFVIEPLYNQISEFQNQKFGRNGFVNTHAFSEAAEIFIDELKGNVDGALLIRNCIDHSPSWPFILSNISEYMTSGSYLLLWNDLLHGPGYEQGHYDITNDVGQFRRLIQNLGFSIKTEYQDQNNLNLNWGCLARKS